MKESINIEALAKKAFYLDNFLIDAHKGMINVDGKSHQIEPKVMDVLLYLVLELGNVVEQEVLFAKVWPKSIYSPGSIRRCITVLRKLFQDDDKSLIVTHPKRGYSLQGKIQLTTESDKTKRFSQKKIIAMLILSMIILLSSASFGLFSSVQNEQVNQNINVLSVSPLTASELHEDAARFSPDGHHIAFIRSIEGNDRLAHVWLKNLDNEQEYQLTKQAANSKSLTWMQTGKAIFYVSAKEQGVSISRITLDEQNQAISEIEVLQLPNQHWISSIAWAETNELYYIGKNKGKYQLIKNNLTTGQRTIIFSEDDSFHPYGIALSRDSKQLAIFALNNQYNATVKLLSTINLSAETIKETKEIHLGQNKYYGSWHPTNKSLVIHDGREMFSLNIHGEMQKLAFENYQYIKYPEFSPDGNKILLTRQVLDEDIWLTPSDKTKPSIKIIDSNTSDFLASLSPDGKKVAFVSIKRGFPQLFLYDIEADKQSLLFENPKQLLFIAYPVWDQSSKRIASALNQRPFIIKLTAKKPEITRLSNSKGVPEQWFFNEESLLLVNYHQGKKAYMQLPLDTQLAIPLISSVEHHAQLNNKNDLLIIAGNSIIQSNFNGSQPTPLVSLDGQILDHYPRENGLYLRVKIQEKISLWLYDYANRRLNKVKELDGSLNIWDIETNNNFLVTSTRRSEKDLLLLTLQSND